MWMRRRSKENSIAHCFSYFDFAYDLWWGVGMRVQQTTFSEESQATLLLFFCTSSSRFMTTLGHKTWLTVLIFFWRYLCAQKLLREELAGYENYCLREFYRKNCARVWCLRLTSSFDKKTKIFSREQNFLEIKEKEKFFFKLSISKDDESPNKDWSLKEGYLLKCKEDSPTKGANVSGCSQWVSSSDKFSLSIGLSSFQ